MKYPNNIFGEMLRKELEASDKISEHFRRGRKGKSIAQDAAVAAQLDIPLEAHLIAKKCDEDAVKILEGGDDGS